MHANPLDAYKSVERSTLAGRELEATVLTRAAMLLAEVKNNWDAPELDDRLTDALRYNQRLWTVLQSELMDEQNPLPNEIKANLLNLSVFIDRRTFEMMSTPKRDGLDILIAINQNLAAGLRDGGAPI